MIAPVSATGLVNAITCASVTAGVSVSALIIVRTSSSLKAPASDAAFSRSIAFSSSLTPESDGFLVVLSVCESLTFASSEARNTLKNSPSVISALSCRLLTAALSARPADFALSDKSASVALSDLPVA